MKKIHLSLLASALIVIHLQADVSMQASQTPQRHDSHDHRLEKARPIVRPIVQYGEHYHTTYVTSNESDCSQYLGLIKEKDTKIEKLLNENAKLKKEAQENLQKRLKEEYDTELKKFEQRTQ